MKLQLARNKLSNIIKYCNASGIGDGVKLFPPYIGFGLGLVLGLYCNVSDIGDC